MKYVNSPEDSAELLPKTMVASAITLAPPWSSYNLRIAGTDTDNNGAFASFQRMETSQPGNLSQTCDLPDSPEGSKFVSAAELCASGDAGLNIYLYARANDETPEKVYQIAHPGDGTWQTLEKTLTLPPGSIHHVKLMVVLRSGDAPLHVRTFSLRKKATAETAEHLEHLHISQAYHDAVMRLVNAHPAANDADFRDRLYRSLAGSNHKGIRTVKAILEQLQPSGFSLEGGRFLDLGCGTGGSLVGAHVHGAAHCEGWEINEEKLALARTNTDSLGTNDRTIAIASKSMEAPDATGPDFRPFHLVCCEEVLEHVKDVQAAIRTLAQCIDSERGVAYVTIPAGYALESVLADPHLKLFGITLLHRDEAQPFATALKHHTHYSQMMGGYCWYAEYVQRFAEAGLDCVPIHPEHHDKKAIVEAERQLESIRQQRATLRETWGGAIADADLTLLESRLDEYIAGATVALAEATARAATDDTRLRFVQAYGVPHLEFLLAPAGSKHLRQRNLA